MIFNYRHYYFIFLIVCSIYTLLNAILSGQLWGDYFGFKVDNYFLYFACFSAFYCLCIYYDIFFRFFSTLKEGGEGNYIIRHIHWFVIIFQLSYFIFNNIYDLNIAGSSVRTNNFLKYIFLIINADYLFLTYFCMSYLSAERLAPLFKINFIIFIVSTISRGWFGFIPFIGMFYIYKTIKCGKYKKLKFLSFILIGGSVVYFIPLLYSLRDSIRTGMDIDFDITRQAIFLQIYFNRLVERFDFVSPLYYMFSEVFKGVGPNEVKPIFMNGIFLSNIYSAFGFDGEALSRLSVKSWFGMDSDNYLRDTAFTSTIIPYFFIDAWQAFFTFLYFHLSVVLLAYISNVYRNSSVTLLNWYMGITLLLAGWAGAFLSFVVTQVIFFLLIKAVGNKVLVR